GQIITIAGNGSRGFSGDRGPAIDAQLSGPAEIAVDGEGDIIFADSYNHVIRRIERGGQIVTIAGDGTAGFSGDGGLAISARLNIPIGVAVDGEDNIIFADSHNHVIRRIDRDGRIATIAGNNKKGFSGDKGRATEAQLNTPAGVTVDGDNNIIFTEVEGNRIRRISPEKIITTIAGTGAKGFDGDYGPAIDAQLAAPMAVAVDSRGNYIVTDVVNHRVRRISAQGIIATIAGNGEKIFEGDGGLAIVARLHIPLGVAVDNRGGTIVTDFASNRIVRFGVTD
ncbi:MAG: hypothetical protein H0T78_10340, partial [Longispora sp.]|nr:hypothetical protein [Longispora sp. (in: high G+C Gram-positive bacteria)]